MIMVDANQASSSTSSLYSAFLSVIQCRSLLCHVPFVSYVQKWGVNEAIAWMEELKDFGLTWIEEPTSPDDVIGHKKISDALEKYGIGVATGEMCQNRTMFKQFLQTGAMQVVTAATHVLYFCISFVGSCHAKAKHFHM